MVRPLRCRVEHSWVRLGSGVRDVIRGPRGLGFRVKASSV